MMNRFRFQFCLPLFLLFLVGCGSGKYAPVSGVVTVNGQPRENVRVVYAPMASEDNGNPGPPSLGVTDTDGRYTLKTRDGDYGAVRGRHNVTFNYDDLDHMEDLKSWLGSAESAEDAAEAKKRIAHVKKEIASRGAISKSASQIITVADGGHDNADFEIGEPSNK